MNQQERDIIAGLFDRLKSAESQQRDPDVDAFIKDRLAQQPGAVYALLQSMYVSEQAMNDLSKRNEGMQGEIRNLQGQIGQMQQHIQQLQQQAQRQKLQVRGALGFIQESNTQRIEENGEGEKEVAEVHVGTALVVSCSLSVVRPF